MILILAHEWDTATHALAGQWVASLAKIVTPRHLSQPGWQYRAGNPDAFRFAIEGESGAVKNIQAIVSRMYWLSEYDLPHIQAADRGYVAAEMNAFLLAFLTEPQCPVVNLPSVNSLCSPFARPESWLKLAAQIGLPTKRLERTARFNQPILPNESNELKKIVTVIGDDCFGEQAELLFDWARRLAIAAKVQLLQVEFEQLNHKWVLCNANPCPDLTEPFLADTLLRLLGHMSQSATSERKHQ